VDLTFLLAASLIYLVATFVYGAYLLHFNQRTATVGKWVLFGALVLHGLSIGYRVQLEVLGTSVFDILLLGSALLTTVFLLLQLRGRQPLFGAFVAPVAMVILYSLHVYSHSNPAISSSEFGIVAPIHIGASLLGFFILMLAAIASILYVIQEHRLKTKRLDVIEASRLPSIQSLQDFHHRAFVIGFPIFSVGVALGAIWLLKGEQVSTVSRHFIMAGFSWLVYAVALYARMASGWKGRRTALLTLMAFASALFVVLLSALRTGAGA